MDSHIAKTVVTKVSCFDSEYLQNEMVMVWFSHQIRKVHSELCLEPYSIYPNECCAYVIYEVKHGEFNIALNGEPIYYCMTLIVELSNITQCYYYNT